jgi:RNA polymerase sigma factor (sigma-70 family)
MNNKEQYFKKVYEHSKDKIYRVCLGYMGNVTDAEDLFQEIVIKVWNNLSSFRRESNIDTWIFRIATNTALLYVSRSKSANKKQEDLESETITAEAIQIDYSPSYSEEDINQLYQAIFTLKKVDRIIISLLLEGNNYSEIAHIVGITTSNVGVRINRIKKTLAKKLK